MRPGRRLGYASAIDPFALPSPSEPGPAWWGTFDLPEAGALRWRIGPLTLWVERRRREWVIATAAGDNVHDQDVEVAVPVDADEVATDAATRFSFADPPRRVQLTPRTADRPVVVRPDAPFQVPVGEEARVYVSTPLWVAVGAAAAAGAPRPLTEVPAHRPSDTWFGPNTLEGELCYAATTSARLELERLPRRPHRAVTPVYVRNHADDALLLERLKVPVPFLSLYRDARAQVWTELVTLERESAGDLAALQIGREAPAEAARAVRVGEPRQRPEPRVTLRAFSRLFGGA